jgi:hypothetical protein
MFKKHHLLHPRALALVTEMTISEQNFNNCIISTFSVESF